MPDASEGYVWPIYDTYDIFRVNVDGTNLTQLTKTPGYDAEATVAEGRPHRVHEHARRRHGDLLDERATART